MLYGFVERKEIDKNARKQERKNAMQYDKSAEKQ